MPKRLALVIAVAVTLVSALAAQKPDADIEALTRQYEEAFNKGDAKALAALHTEDAIRVGANGELAVGRAAIEKQLSSALAGPVKGAKLTLRPGRVQNVTSDVRIVEGRFETTGGSSPTPRGRYVNTLVRQGGQWRAASVVLVPDTSSTAKPGTTGTPPKPDTGGTKK
jgi:uncharacterized protein (TIGR02246 family)